MTKENAKPLLNLSSKTVLKVVAKNGDDDYVFLVEVPNFSYAEKKRKQFEFETEFRKMTDSAQQIIKSAEESFKTISKESFDSLAKEIENPANLQGLKNWFLSNITALDALEIKVSKDVNENITYIKREHEFFEPIFDQMWDKDYIILGLIDRMNKFFKREG